MLDHSLFLRKLDIGERMMTLKLEFQATIKRLASVLLLIRLFEIPSEDVKISAL